jgi:glyoxylase-like metal-dependent hydrolase (beta-lactamase superfamily II)/ferredoxin
MKSAMAALRERVPENVPGEFFVDSSCIDCDKCRQVAPRTFARSDTAGQSYVRRQPGTEEEQLRALMALVACPTASIRTEHQVDAGPGVRAFPERIAGEVYDCGFTAEASFGATSYLIRRPDGNVLVDSPRAAGPLMRRIEELGGVRLLFLSHRDDVADHERLRARFGCERILHADDVSHGTRAVERKIVGHDPVQLAADLTLVPVPGHTRGSMALLHDGFLFSGDHLWGDEDSGRLGASRSVCWWSWPEQVRSIERLLDLSFTWVLPGHGRAFRAQSVEAMRREIRRLLAELR